MLKIPSECYVEDICGRFFVFIFYNYDIYLFLSEIYTIKYENRFI